jgi:hypothetical protein
MFGEPKIDRTTTSEPKLRNLTRIKLSKSSAISARDNVAEGSRNSFLGKEAGIGIVQMRLRSLKGRGFAWGSHIRFELKALARR